MKWHRMKGGGRSWWICEFGFLICDLPRWHEAGSGMARPKTGLPFELVTTRLLSVKAEKCFVRIRGSGGGSRGCRSRNRGSDPLGESATSGTG